MAATNSYLNISELIKDYISQDVDNYLNQSISVNNVTLTCDVYRVKDGSTIDNTVFTGCTANDANTQIIVGIALSVASGVTLTPPYRCKGMIIGSPVSFINDGTISMTARGANAAGQNIALFNTYSISATGGTGGQRSTGYNPHTGTTPSVLSCAGGGSGGCCIYEENNRTCYGGAGSAGTSYSGGSGGAGGNQTGSNVSTDASSNGGRGGNAVSESNFHNGGGAGNPGGSGGPTAGSTGTGGLLIIFSDTIQQNGSLVSNGAKGGDCSRSSYNSCGGGSGGGCIVLLSQSTTETGTHSVTGGASGTYPSGASYSAAGGAGGDGVFASYTELDLDIMPPIGLNLGITSENYLDDIPTVNGRLTALMDKDELMYEYAGERHRAMCTDATFEDCLIRGEQVPDEIEVNISSPQDGQLLKYNATSGKWENATVETKHTYSTTEQVIGKWIDGKPLYEKTVEVNNYTSYTDDNLRRSFEINSVITGIDELINCSGYFLVNTGTYLTGYKFPLGIVAMSATATIDYATPYNTGSGNLNCIYSENNRLGTTKVSLCVTVQYTKTTDSPTV